MGSLRRDGIRFGLVIIIVFFSISPLSAELPGRIIWNSLTTDSGLSQNSVSAIARDSLGRIWFGTQDGLNRFDGRQVTVFYGPPTDHHSAISTSEITALLADDDGGMYIGLENGSVIRFDLSDSGFHHVTDAGDGPVTSLYQFSYDILGILSSGSVYLQSALGVEKISWPHDDRIRTIRSAPSGKPDEYLLIGIEGSTDVLTIYEDGSYKWQGDQDITGDDIHCFITAGDSHYFIRSDGAILTYPEKTEIGRLELPDGVRPTCALYGPHDSIWIGTQGAGLFAVDPESREIRRYTTEDGLPDNTILRTFLDDTGTLWIGTWGAGVAYYHSGIVGFGHWTPEDLKLGSPDVMAIEELDDGRLALGTLGGGVSILSRGTDPVPEVILGIENGYPSDFILSLHQDNYGYLWVGTVANGVYVVDTLSWQIRYHLHTNADAPYRLSSNRVHDVASIGSESIVLAIRETENGPGSFTVLDIRSAEVVMQLDIGTVWNILVPDPGSDTTYLGTETGLMEINVADGTVKRVYPVGFDDPGTRVWTMARMEDGSLVLGTTIGLVLIDPDRTIRHWTTSDGLPNNVVYAILPDSLGKIWITTNKGISSVDPENNTVESFNTTNGLQDLEFNLNSLAQLSDGRYLFGGVNGVNYFLPGDFSVDRTEVDSYLSEIRVFNHVLTRGEEWRGRVLLESSVESAESLVLRYDEDALSFAVSSSDLISPSDTRYRFRLVGLEDDWVESGKRSYRSYTNLDPGEYELRYQSASASAPWPDDFGSLSITIEPPFTATIAFYLIIIFTSAVILLLVIRYYLRLKSEIRERTRLQIRYMELNSTLESRVRQRTIHLEQAHERLLESERLAALGPMMAGIAHEINTPVGVAVTASSWLSEQVNLASDSGPEEMDEFRNSIRQPVDLISRNLDRASKLITNLKTAMIDQDDDHLVDTVIPDYAEEIADTLRIQYKRENVKISIEADETFSVPLPRSALWHILTNLIQNSISHGFEPDESAVIEGDIHIRFHRHDGHLVLDYHDTGKGMDDEVREKVFEPFYTTNRMSGNTGLGLFIVRNIVYKNLSGTIMLDSVPGEGIHMKISFPVTQ